MSGQKQQVLDIPKDYILNEGIRYLFYGNSLNKKSIQKADAFTIIYSDVLDYFNIDRIKAFSAFFYIILYPVVFSDFVNEPMREQKYRFCPRFVK